MYKVFIFVFSLFFVPGICAQHELFLKKHIENFCADYFEGRKSGFLGQKLAALYLQEFFDQTEVQSFDFVNSLHGGVLISDSDTLYHKRDFLYQGFFEPTTFVLDSTWFWRSITAEEILTISKTSNHRKEVFLVDHWLTFLDLMGHEFSKEDFSLREEVQRNKRIYINKDKFINTSNWSASLVDSASKGYTENLLVPLIWRKENEETVVLSAHYDHLGMDTMGIYRGADDNASGVAMLLLLADWLQKKETTEGLTKNVLLAFFSGEEQGLLGSKYFVKSEYLNLSTVSACINFDMIGFVNQEMPKAFIVTYDEIDSSAALFISDNLVVEQLNEQRFLHEFNSDHQSFSDNNIRSFLVFTGLHDYYHTTKDIPQNINYKAMNELFLFLKQWMQEVLFMD